MRSSKRRYRPQVPIGLITVFDAILTSRQTRLEITVCMEIRCQIIFIKHRFWKIHELETFRTRKRILRKKNWRDVAVPEGVQSCFELSIHFPVFFSRELFLVAVHSWFAIQTNVWKAMFFENYLTSDFHTNTACYFKTCLPTRQNGVENRDKAYCSLYWPASNFPQQNHYVINHTDHGNKENDH